MSSSSKDLRPRAKSFIKKNEKAIENAVELLLRKKVTVVTGAGISVAAGIPAFRSGEDRLYSIASKLASLTKKGFLQPATRHKFFSVLDPILERVPDQRKPTVTHRFIKKLCDDKLVTRVYTQNVDDLERKAGVRENYLVQCHGTTSTGSCHAMNDCRQSYDSTAMIEKMATLRDEAGGVIGLNAGITCDKCQLIFVRHDLVLFDDELPLRWTECNQVDVPNTRTLLVIGTSLEVYPVNKYVMDFTCPMIRIDNDPKAVFSSSLSYFVCDASSEIELLYSKP